LAGNGLPASPDFGKFWEGYLIEFPVPVETCRVETAVKGEALPR
jgi:hypothetical protein